MTIFFWLGGMVNGSPKNATVRCPLSETLAEHIHPSTCHVTFSESLTRHMQIYEISE